MYQVRCLNYGLVEDLKQDFVIGSLVEGRKIEGDLVRGMGHQGRETDQLRLV